MKRAQADAGLGGTTLPTIGDLRTAEAPPQPVHRLVRVSYASAPTRDQVDRETRRQLADLVWRASLPSLSRGEVASRARRIAEDRLIASVVSGTTETYEVVNCDDVERGQALAALHGPLLAALSPILGGLDRHVRDGRLAAVDEDRIGEIAADAADQAWQRWRARCGMAAATGRDAPALTPADRRRQCPTWQRRRLRRTAGLARQHLAACLGTIGRGAADYADG